MEEEPHISSTLQWQDVSLPPGITEADLDAAILSVVDQNWRKTAFIISKVTQAFEEHGVPLNYEIVGARVLELGTRGTIDSAGNLSMWRHSEVRLPPSS